jgi:hypothetical protein
VDDALGNALMVKVGYFLAVVKVCISGVAQGSPLRMVGPLSPARIARSVSWLLARSKWQLTETLAPKYVVYGVSLFSSMVNLAIWRVLLSPATVLTAAR